MSTDIALVIIDVQVGLIEEVSQGKEVIANINTLLAKARNSGTPVIYVQHGEPEGRGLAVGTAAWQIHPAIAPQENETIVHKLASDSFYKTSLQRELDERGIKHLVVVGCQTEYCVDTTVRRAISSGYNVTLVADAHTTCDTDVLTAAQIIAHHNATLNGFGNDQCAINVKPTGEIYF